MQISTNYNSQFTQRQRANAETDTSAVLRRLSSGLRINGARDDAAGLTISERMTSQIRGGNQAMRNVNDGFSLLQTAEGAMSSAVNMLQRIRELAVQAVNGSNSVQDRGALQAEVNQLLQGLDQLGRDTQFNGEQLFSQSTGPIGGDANKRAVLDGLQLGWLEVSEKRIKEAFGLVADGVTLTVNLDFTDGAGNVAASVSGTGAAGGRVANQYLNIDMSDFSPANLPNGGNSPFYNDRIIAHEMVHAVMGRTMNFTALPTWFKEGAAELIHGADERVLSDIAANGLANVVNQVAGGWGSNSIDYSSAYIAARYLHETLKSNGHADGIKAAMQYLNQNAGSTLDDALNALTSGTYATAGAFIGSFTGGNSAVGQAFVTNQMNLNNSDTGAIGGMDADRGEVYSAESIIGDQASLAGTEVLEGFKLVFPTLGGGAAQKTYDLQVGANARQTITAFVGAMNSQALGLSDTDLGQLGKFAIYRVDRALEYVSRQRTQLGAVQTRLEASMANLGQQVENESAARSRIRDADYATETASLARQNILQQAATAMVSQANSLPQLALALLR